MGSTAVLLRIERDAELDDDRLDTLASTLRVDLLDLDIEAVRPVQARDLPVGAKGVGSVVGWLSVHLSSAEALRKVLAVTRDWMGRTKRTVHVKVGDKEISVADATAAEQELIIKAFLAVLGTDG